MIEIYSIYLKLLGYLPIKHNENKIYQIINYIHISFMFIILSFPFFYQLIFYIRFFDLNIIISSFITSLEPIQYILTLLYFRKNHFTKLILKNGYNKKFIFKLNIMTIIILFISFIYTIICILLTILLKQSSITRNDNIIFNEINIYTYYTIVIIHKTISSNIFFSVNIFFTNTLLLHSTSLSNLAIKIKTDIKNNKINLLEICNEYLEHKNIYTKTINKLNNIFSITFLTSGSYIYIVIYDILINHITNYVDYVKILFYSIMIIIFSYTQNKINTSINKIKDNIYSSNFISLNLNRANIDFELEEKNNDDLWNKVKNNILKNDISYNNTNIFSYIMDKENAKYIDWLVLSNILNLNWDNISFLGFELNGFDMIKQFITIASTIILILEAIS